MTLEALTIKKNVFDLINYYGHLLLHKKCVFLDLDLPHSQAFEEDVSSSSLQWPSHYLVSLMTAYFVSYVMSSQVLRGTLGTNTQLFLKHGRGCWRQRSQRHGGMILFNLIKFDARYQVKTNIYFMAFYSYIEFLIGVHKM